MLKGLSTLFSPYVNCTFLAFIPAKSSIISSKLILAVVSDSIDKVAKDDSLSWAMDDLKYVLISFKREKLLSALATVTGIVSKILYAMNALGNGF